jgi:acyl carrier protein phosphodiesterase
MNYLAHIFLARHSDAAMVGALLGDFVKGADLGRYRPEIAREIVLHRAIDSHTDRHPLVREALQWFAQGRRRYGGIILDVYFDHLLSQRWAQWAELPRAQLIARFYRALQAHHAILPERLQAIAPRIVAQDWLSGYADFEGVELAVARISQRLSRNGEQMRAGLDDLRAHRRQMAQGFDAFFAELQDYTAQRRAQLLASEAQGAQRQAE